MGKSWLKVPIDETIRRSLGNVSLDQNFCILGVAKIGAGADLRYSFWWRKCFCFNLCKKCSSEASRLKIGPLLSFLNLDVLLLDVSFRCVIPIL